AVPCRSLETPSLVPWVSSCKPPYERQGRVFRATSNFSWRPTTLGSGLAPRLPHRPPRPASVRLGSGVRVQSADRRVTQLLDSPLGRRVPDLQRLRWRVMY